MGIEPVAIKIYTSPRLPPLPLDHRVHIMCSAAKDKRVIILDTGTQMLVFSLCHY